MAAASAGQTPLLVKIVVFVLVLLATALIYFGLWFLDVRSQIAGTNSQEQQLHTDLAAARKAEFAYQQDLQELTRRQQQQRELNKVLPRTTEYPSFLSSLQNVANTAGVSLAAWTPQAETSAKFYARVPLKLELLGRYHQVAYFFHQVGQLERIINIENISITEPTQKGDEFKLKVEALATAFHIGKGPAQGPQGDAKEGAP